MYRLFLQCPSKGVGVVHRVTTRHKNPRKRPPRPDDPVRLTLAYMGRPAHEKRDHCKEACEIAHRQRASLMAALVARDGKRCACCGYTGWLRIDHIRPVSKGGKTELDNLQLLCVRCDEAKGMAIVDYRRL